jgi:ABC-type sugar transport system substrate-binding protein
MSNPIPDSAYRLNSRYDGVPDGDPYWDSTDRGGGQDEQEIAGSRVLAGHHYGPSSRPVSIVAQAKPLKIAFFVSDLSNGFHQAQFAAAKKYAKEKYGAEVFAFDGKSNSELMTSNIDQVVAQGMDMATLHIWDGEAAKPGIEAAISKGIVMTAFFSPIADTGIPVARSDEAHISFAMGAEMATQWKKAFPNKPIVMVELGWPNNTEVQSGRTGPFVKGVLSVDPKAKDLGCLDSSKGPDAAKQIITDLAPSTPR